MSSKAELAAIDAKILKLSVLSIPGPILTGLALLGKYGEPDAIPFEFLTNDTITTAMLAIGGLILVLTLIFIVRLGIAKANAEMRRDS